MEASQFSIWQHVFYPFQIPSQEKNKEALTLEEKVQSVVLPILAACVPAFLTKKWIFAFMAIPLFYALSAYHKISHLIYQKQKEKKAEFPIDEPINEPVAEPINKPIEPINEPINEPTDDPIDEPINEPIDEPIPPSPKVKVKEQRFGQCIPFFERVLKPNLDSIAAKTDDPHLCFIKNNTAPLPEWFQNEYKAESIQKNNLLYLRETCPEINQGLFISIRGDGDCTLRSIGAGIILQSLLVEPHPAIVQMRDQFTQIGKELGKQMVDLPMIIQDMQKQVETLRKQADASEDLIQKHPKSYRFGNGDLNEEGQGMKATIAENRDVADIIEAHIQALNHTDNQKQMQAQLLQINETLSELNALFALHLEKLTNPDEVRRQMIILMEQEKFDQLLITFLRKSSFLNIALNIHKMGNYIKQLGNQEQVILGEMSIFELLIQRANARQPNHEHLQGSINDAQSLSMLFQQPIDWYRCEVQYEHNRIVYHFGSDDGVREKKKFTILNRPGHSDLILV